MGYDITNLIKLRLDTQKINKPKNMADLEDSCWPGYEAIGTKELDGKTVPNCVPIKEEQRTVKEGFPIPSPESDEDEQKYISRCISEIIDEYGQDVASGICYAQWEKK